MKQERVRKQKPTKAEQEQLEKITASSAASKKHDEAVENLDAVLDEIDGVLEEVVGEGTAQDFVKDFVQKGGE